MIVRPAQLGDASRIADIHVTCWHTAYPGMVPDALLAEVTLPEKERAWTKILSEGSRSVLVAAQPDSVVLGWASFGPSRDEDADTPTGELYAMYVDPQAWRTGIGRALWLASLQELQRSCRFITLWVLAANVRARRFYESCGFVLDADAVHKPDRPGLNQVRYGRRIDDAS